MSKSFKLHGLMIALCLAYIGSAHAESLETIQVQGVQTQKALSKTQTKRSQLDENFVSDIRDIVRYDPAVSVVESGRGASNGYAIRGVDKDRVAINIDGLAQAESRSSEAFQDLFGAYGNFNANRNASELEHISMVTIQKGADSISSGSGALGGAVNFSTKKPSDVVNARNPLYLASKVAYTSRDEGLMYTVDTATYQKGFDIRFVGVSRKGHQVKNHASVQQIATKDSAAVYNPLTRAESRFGSVGKFRTKTDPQVYESNSSLIRGGYHFNDYNYLSALYEDYRIDRETNELSNLWAADWQGNPSAERRMRNDVTYTRRYGLQYDNELATGPWDKLVLKWDKQAIQMSTMTWDIPTDFTERGLSSEVYYLFRRIEQNTTRWSAQAQKSLAINEQVEWDMRYGFGGDSLSNHNDNYSVFVRVFNPSVETSNRNDRDMLLEAESKRYHVFWNNALRLNNQWSTQFGLRYDWVRGRTLPDEKFIDAMKQKGLDNAVARFGALSYVLGANYDFNTHWSVQAKYSTGFRAPTTDEMWFTFPHPDMTILANTALKAERANNFELGLDRHGSWGGASLSAFLTHYRDFIEFAYLGKQRSERWDSTQNAWVDRDYEAPTWQNINRAQARVMGLEFSARWQLESIGLPKGLLSTYQLSYTHGRTQGGSGKFIPMNAISPWGMVWSLAYDAPNKRWGLKTTLSYTAAKKAKDTIHSSDDVDHPWPYVKHSHSYTLLDLSAYYQLGKHMTIRAGAFNLFDKQYYTWDSLRSVREFGTVNRVNNIDHQGIQRFTAPGRHYVLSFEAKF